MDSRNVDDCHCTKTQAPKKNIIKFSRCKNANQVQTGKRKSKGNNLISLGQKSANLHKR